MLEDYLKENNLIITSSKRKVIEDINKLGLISYRILTKEEFLNEYYFSYDKATIKYLVENYNLSVETAIEYIRLFVYLVKDNYSDPKLNRLLDMKKALLNNGLLYENKLFKDYLNNTNIIVYECELDLFTKNILNNYKVNYVKNNRNDKEITIYEFDTIEKEIGYICYDIKKKLDQGISINSIKIINPSSEYDNVLDRVFKWSRIPLDYPKKRSLYDLSIGKRIVELLKENKTFEEIICIIDDEDIRNKVISIFNSYINIGINIDMIIYDLKNTYLTDKHISNSVSVISINDVCSEDINYLIGFNKENYPKVYKDDDIISDKIKHELGILTSNENNKEELNRLLGIVYNNDLVITYKLRDSFSNYNKPLVFNNARIISNPKIEYNFSNMFNKEVLSKGYDSFYKYGIISDELLLLKENYPNLEYNTYDNKFTGLDKNNYLESFDKLSLSYSSIDNYFRCGFRYYINNVLKITDTSVDEFYANIGSIFHEVLSKYRNKDFDFEKEWNNSISNYSFTLDKLIFLDNLKEELKFDIETIKKQESLSSMNDYLFERRLNVDIKNNLNKDIRFTGVIDKIIYKKENDKTFVSIIDYKTGFLHKDISNMVYGIDMQLPIYLYLIKNSELFPNSIIVGFYLQKIINKDMKDTTNKSAIELKEGALKLVGYSNSDDSVISKFDSTYVDSNLIQSLKRKKDGGYYSYSKVLDNSMLDKVEDIVNDTINKGINDILDAKFDINPKRIGKDDIGCEYCPFKDICFKTERDVVTYPKKDIKDILGGDINA